ncbi:MAG: PIN domain-containing protein [Desulfobacterales bacterium]|nr:PIN domain-containing protein [Desulfobacterales bacterium]
MSVLVDTCIWSMALRRETTDSTEAVKTLRNLILDHRVSIIGPIRQELLSGIRDRSQFDRLKKNLSAFPDTEIVTDDYVTAARFFNLCRSRGVQGSNTDFLICAVAARNKFPIFTTDKDFEHFSAHLPIVLYKP